jgi:hypothetical protein
VNDPFQKLVLCVELDEGVRVLLLVQDLALGPGAGETVGRGDDGAVEPGNLLKECTLALLGLTRHADVNGVLPEAEHQVRHLGLQIRNLGCEIPEATHQDGGHVLQFGRRLGRACDLCAQNSKPV